MAFRDRSRQKPKNQEYSVAKDLGGRRVPFSGSRRFDPGDVDAQQYLVDAKTSEKSYTLTSHVLRKVTIEAVGKGKIPLLQVNLESLPVHQQKWAVVEWPHFLELLREAGRLPPE